MKIIDLTHTLEGKMPVFPGTEEPILENACTLEEDGFREKKISMYSHTGTHMDAPAHMMDGRCLDDFSVDTFVGSVVVIDADDYEVSLESIMSYEALIQDADFVLLRTKWDCKWGQASYYQGFPAISIEAAEYLAQSKLKGFGTDAISVDLMENKLFTVHKILLEANMILIENLKDLHLVENGDLLSVLPLKIKRADGSPIRAVAMRLE